MVQLHPDNWKCDISASTLKCFLVFIKHHLLSFKSLKIVILFFRFFITNLHVISRLLNNVIYVSWEIYRILYSSNSFNVEVRRADIFVIFFLIVLFLSDKHLLGFSSESIQLLWAIWGGFKRLYIFCVEASFNIFREVRRAHNSDHRQDNLNVSQRGREKCAVVILIESECFDLEFIQMLFG